MVEATLDWQPLLDLGGRTDSRAQLLATATDGSERLSLGELIAHAQTNLIQKRCMRRRLVELRAPRPLSSA